VWAEIANGCEEEEEDTKESCGREKEDVARKEGPAREGKGLAVVGR
jgi:hypothetical protein